MKLSEKLRDLRTQTGKTQEQVAKELSIGIQTLRNYENDKLNRTPSPAQLKQIKDFYNVPYEYLLDDNSNNKDYENLGIGNKLNLSDKTIEKIIEINTNVNSEILGKFIDFLPLNDFWGKIDKYIKLNSEIKELAPTLEIVKCEELLNKYSTKADYEDYLIDIDEHEVEFDSQAFYEENKCNYLQNDKEQLLMYLQLLERNKILHDFPEDEDILIKMHTGCYEAIQEIKICMAHNSKFPLNYTKDLLSEPRYKMSSLKHDQEMIGFYLSNEIINFLNSLSKQEAE